VNREEKSVAPAPVTSSSTDSAGYQGGGAPSGGGLFQQGTAPQVATMQDEVKGELAPADEQPKPEEGDDAGAKIEDSKSAAVISDTNKKLIDLTGDDEGADEEAAAAAAAAAPTMESSIRVGTTQTLGAVPTSPAKDRASAVPVGIDDDDDDDLDLTGVSVPANQDRDLFRRMGSSLAADVHSVAAQPAAEAKDVVKPLGDVKEEEPKEGEAPAAAGEEPKAEEPVEEEPKEEEPKEQEPKEEEPKEEEAPVEPQATL